MALHTITFSPTRTSFKIAEAITSGILDISPCESVTHDLTYLTDTRFTIPADDIAVIAAPVYGGKMAPVAKTRMAGLKAQDTPCILVAVYGNRAFENALNDMAGFVKSLGFIPVAAGAFVGEHSYSTSATPIAAGRPDADDLLAARSFGCAIGSRLLDRSLGPVDTTQLHDIPSPAESIANFRSFVTDYQRQQATAHKQYLPEIDTDACDQCGICVDICPTGAIGDDCRSLDPSLCIKCCACVKGCPSQARSLHSPFAPVLSNNFSTPKAPILSI